MSDPFRSGLTPKMRPVSVRKTVIVSVLDVGTSKVACVIARLRPRESGDVLPTRTHSVEVLGFGHTRSRGLKGGAVVEMSLAEDSIRNAVAAAERMADVQVESVLLSFAGGRLKSEHFEANIAVSNPKVSESDIHRVLAAGSSHAVKPGRSVLHALPISYAVDETPGVRDPRGMLASTLGVDMHVATTDTTPARNLLLSVERCHLGVEAMVAAPYAAGLAVLSDDEADLGVGCLDMGGGTTTLSIFHGGHLVQVEGVAVGGLHVTSDIARGLGCRLAEAERIKVLHGSVITSTADERDMIVVPGSGEDERDGANLIAKSQITRIIKPRLEEILELVRDRLNASPWAPSRIVLTGGAAQLTGLQDLAARVLGRQVRVGRPLGVTKLPEAAKGPAFAAAVGLMVYPQVVRFENFEMRPARAQATGTDNYFARVGRWLRDSF